MVYNLLHNKIIFTVLFVPCSNNNIKYFQLDLFKINFPISPLPNSLTCVDDNCMGLLFHYEIYLVALG